MNASDTKRFLMVPFGHGGESVIRLLCLSSHLQAMGHKVEFACGEPAARVAGGAGYRIHSLNEVGLDAWKSARAEGVLQLHDEATVNAHVRQESELIRQQRFDIVVGDGRLTLPISAHMTRTRYAQVVRVDQSGLRPEPPPMPASKQKIIAGVNVTDRMPAAMRQQMLKGMLRTWAAPYNRVRKRFGMPQAAGVLDVGTGPFNLLADVPELYPIGTLPETYRWAGPLLPPLPSDAPMPQCLEELTDERPIVIASLERLGHAELLTDVIRRFVSSAFQVVLITGNLIKPEQIPDLPANFTMTPTLPAGDQIWRRATALFFDGYTPLMYVALRYKVPVVGLAYATDAADNLKRAAAAQVGVHLTEGMARAVLSVQQAITKAQMTDHLKEMSAAIETYDNAKAARLLAEYAITGKPPKEEGA